MSSKSGRPSKKFGTIVAIENGRQRIQCDDGDWMDLTPHFDAAKGGKVGDRVELEYRSTRSLGLWYAKVLKPDAPGNR